MVALWLNHLSTNCLQMCMLFARQHDRTRPHNTSCLLTLFHVVKWQASSVGHATPARLSSHNSLLICYSRHFNDSKGGDFFASDDRLCCTRTILLSDDRISPLHEDWQGRSNPLTSGCSASVCLSFCTQLNPAVRAWVSEYLEPRVQRLGCRNKYELMEFDIDARFYKYCH